MHVDLCVCGGGGGTDCACTCESLCLQNLFHVTDVFLPPDYVANLQKVNDPTLTNTVAPAMCSCHLVPFHQSMQHTVLDIPCLWLPSKAVCLLTSPHTLQCGIQQHS